MLFSYSSTLRCMAGTELTWLFVSNVQNLVYADTVGGVDGGGLGDEVQVRNERLSSSPRTPVESAQYD